jgi:hypothetical protein
MQPQPAVALDGSQPVTDDVELYTTIIGPECANMMRDAADPVGVCDCLKAAALGANATGPTQDQLTQLMQCL